MTMTSIFLKIHFGILFILPYLWLQVPTIASLFVYLRWFHPWGSLHFVLHLSPFGHKENIAIKILCQQ